MPTDGLKDGFICTCGRAHKFPMYVYAHYRKRLAFTCPCGVSWDIQAGVASNRDTVAKELVVKEKTHAD